MKQKENECSCENVMQLFMNCSFRCHILFIMDILWMYDGNTRKKFYYVHDACQSVLQFKERFNKLKCDKFSGLW